ncbi:low molecular weight phosphotyrosine protein phosphatase [Kytococcus schroeteri]|uniref:protein-tyrosine-phosphatase n=1 Tax=Kytococcus schroeteri TaxID=138300 RepID=A0A2I1PAT6_9MICO|nr:MULTISPECIES: low molecular weight protein-tyrosine-phosphatase [Kytococcus]OFS13133.1 protein tyrosine phosphatase [Kytococcus sp. HMSC28H12]PKZ41749.1 low molecular weight phosphotyrosine protein phosphatase [Kytococcus schroeteri]
MRIEVVCLGNICRSPAAEAVLVHELRAAGIEDVEVTSAGTGGWHVGEEPYHLSRAEGERRGYVFDTVARQLGAREVAEADLVLVMDESNLRDVRALSPDAEAARRVVMLGAFAPGAERDGAQAVPDPYGQDAPAFTAMYDQVEPAVRGVVRAIEDGRVDEVLDREAARMP